MDIIRAYRAELQGLYAILRATWVICQCHSLTTGYLKIACDNLESIKQSSNPHPDPVAALKNVDLIRSIRCIAARLPLSIDFEHVRGHQDDVTNHTLTLLELLNCEMDYAAKEYLHQLTVAGHQQSLPPCSSRLFG
jgi:hypothetical protein